MPRHRRLASRAGAIALLLLVAGRAGADELDDYVRRQMAALHLPGVALAIVRDGRVVRRGAYGYADLEQQVPVRTDTVFEIGSDTKQFTAALVAMLVAEGKIGLDDPLTRWFPAAPEWWSRIHVRHLLTHTGGIQNHVAVHELLGMFTTNLFLEGRPTKEETLARFYALPREFAPGATWSYDNGGYILLGWILEQASGKSYWQLLQERILDPLGMAATRSTDPRPLVPQRARGYGWVDGHYENRAVLWPHAAFSAGAMLSTVDDLARWDAALRSDRLLDAATRAQMWTPARGADGSELPFDYGWGWFIDSQHGHRIVEHDGGTPGFSSLIYRFLDDGLTVILLTNHGDFDSDGLAVDVAGIVEPALRRAESAPDPDPATTVRLQRVFAGLLAGEPDGAAFTEPMRAFLATATGKGLYRDLGRVDGFRYADEERRGAERVLRYRVTLDGAPLWFSFHLDAQGKVAQLTWW